MSVLDLETSLVHRESWHTTAAGTDEVVLSCDVYDCDVHAIRTAHVDVRRVFLDLTCMTCIARPR